MGKKILVAVAWPYASASIHIGNMAGADLPPDIYARYHRLKGNDVLMVSGSDSHGTPVMVRADQENSTPRQVFERFHDEFLETFQKMGLTYDLYTHTDTENHHWVARTLFTRLLENGYLYTRTEEHPYSVTEGRFLPDRYVEGTCPRCGYDGARGDQCDNCGTLLNAIELIDPRSRNDGSTPEIRETTHYFLDLPALAEQLIAWLDEGRTLLSWGNGMVRRWDVDSGRELSSFRVERGLDRATVSPDGQLFAVPEYDNESRTRRVRL